MESLKLLCQLLVGLLLDLLRHLLSELGVLVSDRVFVVNHHEVFLREHFVLLLLRVHALSLQKRSVVPALLVDFCLACELNLRF